MDVVLTTDHPVAQCVDLRTMFGDHFRCEFEESYFAELPEYRAVEACWLTIIPCKYGHIYPQGGRMLAAYSGSRLKRHELARLDCVEMYVEGDHELTVVFDVGDFDKVAAVLEPQRRRRLSAEHKAKLLAASAPYRFTAGNPGSGVSLEGLGTIETTQDGSAVELPIP